MFNSSRPLSDMAAAYRFTTLYFFIFLTKRPTSPDAFPMWHLLRGGKNILFFNLAWRQRTSMAEQKESRSLCTGARIEYLSKIFLFCLVFVFTLIFKTLSLGIVLFPTAPMILLKHCFNLRCLQKRKNNVATLMVLTQQLCFKEVLKKNSWQNNTG